MKDEYWTPIEYSWASTRFEMDRPTPEDADSLGYVWGFHPWEGKHGKVRLVHPSWAHPKFACTHWKPTGIIVPEAPEFEV